MRTHKFSVLTWQFSELVAGRATFLYFRGGYDVSVGDQALMEEWDPSKKVLFHGVGGGMAAGAFTGRRAEAVIGHVQRGIPGMPSGHCILGVRQPEVL